MYVIILVLLKREGYYHPARFQRNVLFYKIVDKVTLEDGVILEATIDLKYTVIFENHIL